MELGFIQSTEHTILDPVSLNKEGHQWKLEAYMRAAECAASHHDLGA